MTRGPSVEREIVKKCTRGEHFSSKGSPPRRLLLVEEQTPRDSWLFQTTRPAEALRSGTSLPAPPGWRSVGDPQVSHPDTTKLTQQPLLYSLNQPFVMVTF